MKKLTLTVLSCLLFLLFTESASAGSYKNNYYKLNLNYSSSWKPVQVDEPNLLLSLVYRDNITSLNVYAYTYADTVTANGFQTRRIASMYDGWLRLGGRDASPDEIKQANVDEGLLGIYSKTIGNLSDPKYLLVADYYFVKSNRAYMISLRTRKYRWRYVKRSYKKLVDSFWIGNGIKPIVRKTYTKVVDWTMQGRNPQNHNSIGSGYNLNNETSTVWSIEDETLKFSPQTPHPLYVKGHTYITTDKKVVSYSAYDGTKNWETALPNPSKTSSAFHNGYLYVLTEGNPESLQVLNTESGNIESTIELKRKGNRSPIIANEQLFLFDRESISAYDLKEKKWIWEKTFKAKDNHLPIVSGNYLVVVDHRNRINLLNTKTGNTYWSILFDNNIKFTPQIYKDMLIISYLKPSGFSNTPHIQAIDLEKGNRLWDFEATGYSEILSSPSIDQNMVYSKLKYGNKDMILAVDANTGVEIWHHAIERYGPNPDINPIVTDKVIYTVKESEDGDTTLTSLNIRTGQAGESISLNESLEQKTPPLLHITPYKDQLFLMTSGSPNSFFSLK